MPFVLALSLFIFRPALRCLLLFPLLLLLLLLLAVFFLRFPFRLFLFALAPAKVYVKHIFLK